MGRLNGKVIVVTGGARGMGAQHVRRMVEEGAKVAATDILEDDGKELEKELGNNVHFIKHDVTKAEDWEMVIQETEKIFGPINVLVNNAGIDISEIDLEDYPEETYRKVIDVNQVSVFLGMKHVAPSMKKAEEGSIVNISSLAGIIGAYKKGAYTASKFAVRGMTKAAALELGEFGVRVNSVHPGFIRTPMTEHLINDELVSAFPLKRAGEPEEVTNVVLFLASDESSYVTGIELVIDGGLSAQ
ncbi:glucose 1-dehydrogenase [Oceanobacillus timonensis]|uniref:glucose 1-dehydrogenase n=1 Tax=Oceanobacillus timonensis TaxID=1926285 RepID=UPI0009BAB47C|nr:glucose 1-dehydrogenase [Oceanobacillus timonensis]